MNSVRFVQALFKRICNPYTNDRRIAYPPERESASKARALYVPRFFLTEKLRLRGEIHTIRFHCLLLLGSIKETKTHRTLLLLLFLLLLFKFRLPLLLKFTLQALLLLYSELDQKTLLSVLSLQEAA